MARATHGDPTPAPGRATSRACADIWPNPNTNIKSEHPRTPHRRTRHPKGDRPPTAQPNGGGTPTRSPKPPKRRTTTKGWGRRRTRASASAQQVAGTDAPTVRRLRAPTTRERPTDGLDTPKATDRPRHSRTAAERKTKTTQKPKKSIKLATESSAILHSPAGRHPDSLTDSTTEETTARALNTSPTE